MKTRLIIFITAALMTMSCGEAKKQKDVSAYKLSNAEKEEIMTSFLATQDAWNTGDLEEFMKGYWESDKLVFTGAAGPTYGYDATLKRYKQSYPNTDAMGMLKFTVKDLRKIDNSTALMIGKFYLSRTMGDLLGHYTLVWQKIDGKWLIVSDHSSGQLVKE